MGYTHAAWERAMKIQEVILRALSGEIHWFQAAEILGMSPRTLRRWKTGFQRFGYDGLIDQRRRLPSGRKTPVDQVERVLGLYRETYRGWNVRHFHQTVRREHGIALSYTLVKKLLQEAGLVRRKKARGRHRLRREPRPCFGEMVLIDGSDHRWLSLVSEERQTLVSVIDDATSRMLYAQLWEGETTRAILTALYHVVRTYGIPGALYSDRASWAFETPRAGAPVDKARLTRVGSVLKRLGVEHIPSYSPQGRGRCERVHRTFQDRLTKELTLVRAKSLAAANEYIRERYLPVHNESFSRPASDPATAFVPVDDADLEAIFFEEELRQVAKDNTVVFEGVRLQLRPQPGRRTCAGLQVSVRRQIEGTYSVWRGVQMLGRYDSHGRPVEAVGPVDAGNGPGAHKDLGRRRNGRRRPQLPQAAPPANIQQKRSDHLSNTSGQFTC
ncbi:MAG TPA: ISNCY family transposase [Vicinamibacteria bacterium]|nr:ISNCY family transposase [Vicinamibacteria bacterium]